MGEMSKQIVWIIDGICQSYAAKYELVFSEVSKNGGNIKFMFIINHSIVLMNKSPGDTVFFFYFYSLSYNLPPVIYASLKCYSSMSSTESGVLS